MDVVGNLHESVHLRAERRPLRSDFAHICKRHCAPGDDGRLLLNDRIAFNAQPDLKGSARSLLNAFYAEAEGVRRPVEFSLDDVAALLTQRFLGPPAASADRAAVRDVETPQPD